MCAISGEPPVMEVKGFLMLINKTLVLHEVLLTMTIQESSRIELNDYWNQEWLSLMKWVDCIGLLELKIFLPQKCKIDDFYLFTVVAAVWNILSHRATVFRVCLHNCTSKSPGLARYTWFVLSRLLRFWIATFEVGLDIRMPWCFGKPWIIGGFNAPGVGMDVPKNHKDLHSGKTLV